MSVEYAPKGLIGVLVPQASTTVEPELGILWPAGYAMIGARMTSPRGSIEERLIDYYESLDQTLAQFANAPLSALASAITGASYLIGTRREDEIFGRISAQRGIPATNAALSVVAALRALGAARIGLVSPYPRSLTESSIAYWQSRGLVVAAVRQMDVDDSQFHPIYSIRAAGAAQALASMGDEKVDAVVMLGTGMPTLGSILAAPRVGDAPVFSCTLALAWHTVQLLDGVEPAAQTLLEFIAGSEWRHRYLDRCRHVA